MRELKKIEKIIDWLPEKSPVLTIFLGLGLLFFAFSVIILLIKILFCLIAIVAIVLAVINLLTKKMVNDLKIGF